MTLHVFFIFNVISWSLGMRARGREEDELEFKEHNGRSRMGEKVIKQVKIGCIDRKGLKRQIKVIVVL